ncbi:hypothetical protein V2J09_006716, partial [Rumex salicifolius]
NSSRSLSSFHLLPFHSQSRFHANSKTPSVIFFPPFGFHCCRHHRHLSFVHHLSTREAQFEFLVMSHYITQGNIALILRWFPVKTLLQFRCVCKEWKELIDSPLFIKEHLSLQNPRFFIQSSLGFHVLDPHTSPSSKILRIPFKDINYSYWGTHNGNNLMLGNPSINKFLRVPIPKYKDRGCERINVHSGFGFWIDPSTKDFKIFIFTPIVDPDEMEQVDVVAVLYSSTRHDWRRLIPPPWLKYVDVRPPVMVQGVAHWRAFRSEEDDIGIIMSFDFVSEIIGLIEMPSLNYCVGHPLLCHWQGNLSLVIRDQKHPDRCNMHMRQEGAWDNMFGFEIIPRMDRVLWVLGDEEWLIMVVYLLTGDIVNPGSEDVFGWLEGDCP